MTRHRGGTQPEGTAAVQRHRRGQGGRHSTGCEGDAAADVAGMKPTPRTAGPSVPCREGPWDGVVGGGRGSPEKIWRDGGSRTGLVRSGLWRCALLPAGCHIRGRGSGGIVSAPPPPPPHTHTHSFGLLFILCVFLSFVYLSIYLLICYLFYYLLFIIIFFVIYLVIFSSPVAIISGACIAVASCCPPLRPAGRRHRRRDQPAGPGPPGAHPGPVRHAPRPLLPLHPRRHRLLGPGRLRAAPPRPRGPRARPRARGPRPPVAAGPPHLRPVPARHWPEGPCRPLGGAWAADGRWGSAQSVRCRLWCRGRRRWG